MRKAVLLLALVALLTGAGAGAPSWAAVPSPTSCVAQHLPLPIHHDEGQVASGSPDGRYLIGTDEVGGLVWHDRRIAAVVRRGDLVAVNNDGVIVGDTGGTQPRPAVLQGNTLTPLKGVATGQALDINASGVIVGTRYGLLPHSVVVRWSSVKATPVTLIGPRGYSVVLGAAVADDGTVIASLGIAPRQTSHGAASITYVWPPHGAGYRMPEPPVHGKPLVPPSIIGVNGRQVAWSVVIDGEHRGRTLRYDLHTRRYQSLPATVETEAINVRGWVVGTPYATADQPVLQTPGHTITLTPSWADGVNVAVISDDGRTAAGTGERGGKDGVSFPLVWDCR
jgi:hypothetical protein